MKLSVQKKVTENTQEKSCDLLLFCRNSSIVVIVVVCSFLYIFLYVYYPPIVHRDGFFLHFIYIREYIVNVSTKTTKNVPMKKQYVTLKLLLFALCLSFSLLLFIFFRIFKKPKMADAPTPQEDDKECKG